MGVIMSIKKKDTSKVLARKSKYFKKIASGFPAHKFVGKIKFTGNPVDEQRKLRNDWE